MESPNLDPSPLEPSPVTGFTPLDLDSTSSSTSPLKNKTFQMLLGLALLLVLGGAIGLAFFGPARDNQAAPMVTPSPSPSSKPSPTPPQSNLYYQNVSCTYADQPTGSGWTSTDINNKAFYQSKTPTNVICGFLVQNSETTPTGEIEYTISVDNVVVERLKHPPLQKGKWPESDFITQSYSVLLPNTIGLHDIVITFNPGRTFAETSHDDNVYRARYSVQKDP